MFIVKEFNKEGSNISPKYLGIEGMGGAGKDTAAPFVKKIWETNTRRIVVLTREPGGTPFAEDMRINIFNAKNDKRVSPMGLIKMFYEARESTINEVVRPNLKRGRHVLSVRHYASTFAWEGAGEGVSEKQILTEHKRVLGKFGADLTYYLKVSSPLIGLNRKGGNHAGDAFDDEKIEYLFRVQDAYDRMAATYQYGSSRRDKIFGNWITIDADVSVDLVMDQINARTQEYLKDLR